MDSIEAIAVLRKYFPDYRIRVEAAVIDAPHEAQRLEWSVALTAPDADAYRSWAVCFHADLGAAVRAMLIKAGRPAEAAGV